VRYIVGTDTGGTSTDCVAVGDDGSLAHAKTLTTRRDLSQGLLTGIGLLAEQLGMTMTDLLAASERVGHGSTVGTNLIVEHRWARTLLITTAGHADVLFLMRGGHARVVGVPRELVHSVHNTSLPSPLVPCDRVVEVHERVDARGDIVAPLNEERARRDLARSLEASDVTSVAICLLWSFRNPTHELRLAEIVRELAPQAFVSLSHEVAPRTGEYERAAATVINALVGPTSTEYLTRLRSKLVDAGQEAS
jgi:N-methylhydantoinase A